MAITYSNKTINRQSMQRGGEAVLRLSLGAVPQIQNQPADIVLALDCSQASPLGNLKSGAAAVIDFVEKVSDGMEDGLIGGGSRMSVVGFADEAEQVTPLIVSAQSLHAAVGSLRPQNAAADYADAFVKAGDILRESPDGTAKVLVLLAGGEPLCSGASRSAEELRAAGVEIFALGLGGCGRIDERSLKIWASRPDDRHVFFTRQESCLEPLFGKLAISVCGPGATDLVLVETLNPEFQIRSILSYSKGSVRLLTDNSLKWTLPALGESGGEEAVLELEIVCVSEESGKIQVNDSVMYRDREGNRPCFPNPTVTINVCGTEPGDGEPGDGEPEGGEPGDGEPGDGEPGDGEPEGGEPGDGEPGDGEPGDGEPEGGEPEGGEPGDGAGSCPQPVDITLGGCTHFIEKDLGELTLCGLGAVLRLDLTLKQVCPDKRVALAVLLTELDSDEVEHRRGLKVQTIPAHHDQCCRDIRVRGILFALPGNPDAAGEPGGFCAPRNLRVRVVAHYAD